MNDHGKGSMRSSIRRQGARSWQVRVYNRTAARKYEYFTATGDMKGARDARNRRLAQIAKGSKPPPSAPGRSRSASSQRSSGFEKLAAGRLRVLAAPRGPTRSIRAPVDHEDVPNDCRRGRPAAPPAKPLLRDATPRGRRAGG